VWNVPRPSIIPAAARPPLPRPHPSAPLPSPEIFFAACAPGLEPVLHEEVRALRLARSERQVGGVRFEGTLADARRANLELRTAVRVLRRLTRFHAADGDALYAAVRELPWERLVPEGGTLRVDAQSSESALDHTLFIEQRVKDAVVDALRERRGARPDVSKDDPDVPLHVHVFRDRCTLALDTSGDSLHLRGWRRFQGRAPLAETLAAGLVLSSGWDRRAPLVDPFAGSGTILVEAALWALDVAPGLSRERFAFRRWPDHDETAWQAQRAAAQARRRALPKLALLGFEADRATVDGARENLAAAGVAENVTLECARAQDWQPRRGWNAWIVTNPPYGHRVGERGGERGDVAGLYRAFGALLRERCAGYRLALLSGDTQLTQALGLAPLRRSALKNGGLDCELVAFEL